jgi:hypothetical protein
LRTLDAYSFSKEILFAILITPQILYFKSTIFRHF